MRILLIIITSILVTGQVSAQLLYDNNWALGYNLETSLIQFKDTLMVDAVTQPLRIGPTNGTISNAQGELLFYTNGCEIYDSTFTQMQNGFGLNPGSIADDYCDFGYPTIHQGLIILPSLSNDNIYHIFHKRIIIDANTVELIVTDSLFHSIVNMSLNDGKGAVVQKNKPINSTRTSNGYLTAVKKKDVNAWWIITPMNNSNAYEIYELSADSISSIKIQNIGEEVLEISSELQITMSVDGSKYIRACSDQGIYIFDFDRGSGQLSNPQIVEHEDENFVGGLAISSNSRFLYINSPVKIWQYDLWAENVEDSKTLIAEYDGFLSPFSTNFYKAQLGSDCKIYYNSTNGVDVLHVMHNPNVKGQACNFEQHGIQLPDYNGASLPYFPSFRLDSDYPICDTTRLVATSINIPTPVKQQLFTATPNPTSGICHLSTTIPLDSDAVVRLIDPAGREVLRKSIIKHARSLPLDLSNFSNGVYFYQVLGVNGILGTGKILVVD